MKIEIDLEKEFPGEWRELHSKPEYDALTHSPAGMEREQLGCSTSGVRRSHGPIEVYSQDPDHFPCILIERVIRHKSNGADEITTFYLYHYKRLEDHETETKSSTD